MSSECGDGDFAAPAAPVVPENTQARGPRSYPPELKYEVPAWSAPCHVAGFRLDVYKGGKELEPVDLDAAMEEEGWALVGRLPDDSPVPCHLQLLHPTISRQHAVFQSKAGGRLLLYDLDSTHGTFVNKRRLRPRSYMPLRAGDLVSFGQSSRLYGVEAERPEGIVGFVEEAAAAPSRTTPASEEAPAATEEKKEGEVFVGSYSEMKEFLQKKGKHQKQWKKQEEKARRLAEIGRLEGTDNNGAEEGSEDDEEEGGEDDERGRVRGTDQFLGQAAVFGDEDDEFFDRAGRSREEEAARRKKQLEQRKKKAHTTKSLQEQLAALQKRITQEEGAIADLDRAMAAKGKKKGGEDDGEDLDDVLFSMMNQDRAKKRKVLAKRLQDLRKERANVERLLRLAGGSLDAAMPLQAPTTKGPARQKPSPSLEAAESEPRPGDKVPSPTNALTSARVLSHSIATHGYQ